MQWLLKFAKDCSYEFNNCSREVRELFFKDIYYARPLSQNSKAVGSSLYLEHSTIFLPERLHPLNAIATHATTKRHSTFAINVPAITCHINIQLRIQSYYIH